MKLIIAGSRSFSDIDLWFIEAILRTNSIHVDEIVSGGCPTGPDKACIDLAKHYEINYKVFLPDWDKHGHAAGPLRNKQMAEYGDKLLLIWDGRSKGSKSMKLEMEKLNKPILEVIMKGSIK